MRDCTDREEGREGERETDRDTLSEQQGCIWAVFLQQINMKLFAGVKVF